MIEPVQVGGATTKWIVAQNGIINMSAVKCISFPQTEGHLAVEYIDGTMTEVVFNTQAEARQAMLEFIKNRVIAAEWEAELAAPITEDEE